VNGDLKVKNGAAKVKGAIERKRCADGDGDDDEDCSMRSGSSIGSSEPNDNHTPRQQRSQVQSSRTNIEDENETKLTTGCQISCNRRGKNER
jgi:hypothetical protein